MNGLTLDDLQLVHSAWSAGSFTAAAETLGIGQATVSRRIAAVEERLGERLFDRHRTGLVPTPAAHALRPHLEALVAAADGALRAIDGLEREAVGEVRIAASPGICFDVAPELAARLAKTHPEIRLDFLADIRARDLDRREADLALRLMPTTHGDLLVRRIATLAGGLYAARSVIEALPPNPTPDDVPIVSWSEELSDIPIARFLAGLSTRPPAMRTNDYLVLRNAVVGGVGATLLGRTEARALGLVEVPVSIPEIPASPLFLVVHRALRHVPRIAVVIEAIESMVRTRSAPQPSPAPRGM